MQTASDRLSHGLSWPALGHAGLAVCLILAGCSGAGHPDGLASGAQGHPAGGPGGPGVGPEDDDWESTMTLVRDDDPLVNRVNQYAHQIAEADRRASDPVGNGHTQGQGIVSGATDAADEHDKDGQANAGDLQHAQVVWSDRYALRASRWGSTGLGVRQQETSRALAMLRAHGRVGNVGEAGNPGGAVSGLGRAEDAGHAEAGASASHLPSVISTAGTSSFSSIQLVSSQIQNDTDQLPQLRALKLAVLGSLSTDVDIAALLSEDSQLTRRQGRELVHLNDFLVSLREDIAGGQTQLSRSVIEKHLHKVYAQQPIAIGHVALTRSVTSYGVYEPFAESRFLAGRENPLIVYVELDHFQVNETASQHFQVRLAEELELYTDQPNPTLVWRQPRQEVVDESLNRRRDFFIRQLIRLPASLSVGKYILNVRVTDVADGSIDERKLPITIVADARMVDNVTSEAKRESINGLIERLTK